MQITRKIMAGAITAALALSGTGMAAAQSSFSSSKDTPVQPMPQPEPQPEDPETPEVPGEEAPDSPLHGEARADLIAAIAGHYERLGYAIDPAPTAIAQKIADARDIGITNIDEIVDTPGRYSIETYGNSQIQAVADVYNSNPNTIEYHGLPIGVAIAGNDTETLIVTYMP
ncbi:hypothetical protein [Corynebacterium sp. A21]|uniref:hypothetical protein n=1 Tax=Corynebacterium sp. A21 TaxID=3457318 RepID=UPI003FCF6182